MKEVEEIKEKILSDQGGNNLKRKIFKIKSYNKHNN